MARIMLTTVMVLTILATGFADLGFMHAGNEAWPPHARFHAIWNVLHVGATHAIALGLLWIGDNAGNVLRFRAAALIALVLPGSFIVAALAAPGFAASVHPDLAPERLPPTLFGMDGNLAGFLVVLPFVAYAWWSSEHRAG